MADTFSAILRQRLQETGGNTNVWGAFLNAGALQLIEDAIAGAAPITVAGSDITLTTNNGVADQARMAMLFLSGAPGATRNINIPAATKLYMVRNATGSTQNVRVTGGAGVSAAVRNGYAVWVFCDGTDCFIVDGDPAAVVDNATNAADAALLSAQARASTATANTVAGRDANADLFARYFNSSASNGENPTISQIIVTNGADGFLRKATLAHLQAALAILSSQLTAVVATSAGGLTASLGNCNRMWTITAAGTITLPASVAVGNWIAIERATSGAVGFAAGGGATVRSPGGRLSISEQWGRAVAVVVATDTWSLDGGLA